MTSRLSQHHVHCFLNNIWHTGGRKLEGVKTPAHRRREDIAVDVAAGAQRAAHVLDHAGEHGLQVLLQHAVQLIRLPRCQPQRAVAELRAPALTRLPDAADSASTMLRGRQPLLCSCLKASQNCKRLQECGTNNLL